MGSASPDVFQGVTEFTVTPFLFCLLKAGSRIFMFGRSGLVERPVRISGL
jgi:hypothetical protein